MPKEKSIHKLLSFMLFLVALSFSAACSSTPSESEGKKVLDAKGAETKLYKVKSFRKTNGVSEERNYRMEFEAELECLQPGTIPVNWKKSFNVITCRSIGEVGKIDGSLVFEKTENGWRVRE
jgi:hypothetical protein